MVRIIWRIADAGIDLGRRRHDFHAVAEIQLALPDDLAIGEAIPLDWAVGLEYRRSK